MKLGLPHPKLDPIIAAAKKDPKLAQEIKKQLSSKEVKMGAGTKQAADYAQQANQK